MSDSIDSPTFSNIEDVSQSYSGDGYFMVFPTNPNTATKATAKCISAESLQNALQSNHPALSVEFSANTPSFNSENQALQLPNAPRFTPEAVSNGMTYTFTSGDGVQSTVLFIPDQESLVHEPAGGQIFRWRFTKQANNPEQEATSIVIEIPIIVDPAILFHPSLIVRSGANGKVPKYEAGGKLGAYAFYSVESDGSTSTRSEYAAGRTVWNYTGVSNAVIVNTLNLSTGSADGSYIVYDPKMTTENTSMIKSLTIDSEGAIIPELDSDQRDELTPTKFNRLIFNTDTGKLNLYNGTAWREIHDNAI